MLLAHAPKEIQEEYLSAPLPRFTGYSVTDPTRLRSILAGVRREGYAVSDRMVGMDALCVGAPIYAADGSVVAAVSICSRAGTQSPQLLARSVLAAARRISKALPADR